MKDTRREGFLRRVGWTMACVLVLAGGACAKPASSPADREAQAFAPQPSELFAPPGANAPRCVYRENAFRSGVNPPRNVHRVEPDLTGLPPLATEAIAIVEVRIDAAGRVTESCLRLGVRADVDQKVLEAVRDWRFDPPHLSSDTQTSGGRVAAGTAVPVFMTVTVRVGPG